MVYMMAVRVVVGTVNTATTTITTVAPIAGRSVAVAQLFHQNTMIHVIVVVVVVVVVVTVAIGVGAAAAAAAAAIAADTNTVPIGTVHHAYVGVRRTTDVVLLHTECCRIERDRWRYAAQQLGRLNR
uniref:Uncharacterized protein n=1 Tax=Anopheles darlingi TaxID=43151 RepID=A0A2M4D8G7_ANODA